MTEVRGRVLNSFQEYAEVEEAMQQYKSKYEALVVQHSKTMEEQAQQSFLRNEEENKKIFADRSIK